jgi:TetR/AcrR family transcriptional regulator, transcriptional repressor for nem operon
MTVRGTRAGGNAKAAQKERSHRAILDSAARLLREKGISGARVADVMQGADLTVGGFYAHFGSKDELVDEALRRTGSELRDRLFTRMEAKPEKARAEAILERYLSAAHRDALEPGCPLPAVVGEIGTSAPQHGRVLGEQIEAIASRLRKLLPPRSRPLALGLVALMYGGLTLARALKGTNLSDEVLRACRAMGVAAIRAAQKKR